MRTPDGSEPRGNLLQKGVPFLQPRLQRTLYVLASLLFPVLIAVGSWLDGTWVMHGADKGFSQYYGFWAIFATTPLILLLTTQLFDAFTAVVRRPDRYCANLTDDASARVERLILRHTRSLSLHSGSAWILVFVTIVLLFWWVFNVIGTISPTPLKTFHHDVFDSSSHPFGFYATRCYLLMIFVFAYSPAVFLVLHVTASMISILKFLCRNNILYVNFFHADNCGGTSEFGDINLLILSIYGAFFAIISAQYLTHRETYFVMMVSLTACSLLAVAQSVAAVYYIHKAVAQKKRDCIDAVTARLNDQLVPTLHGERFPNELLAFRNHLIGIHTFPYAGGALVAVNVIRFAPAALAVIGLLKHP